MRNQNQEPHRKGEVYHTDGFLEKAIFGRSFFSLHKPGIFV